MVISREETQRKLDKRAIASNTVKPDQPYTIADRLEEKARDFPERPFLYYGDENLRGQRRIVWENNASLTPEHC